MVWAPSSHWVDQELYIKVLYRHMRPSVPQIKLGPNWVTEKNNDPKQSSKSPGERLKKQRIKVPQQSEVQTSTWFKRTQDLDRTGHKQIPADLNELMQHCKEEWTKVPPQRCDSMTFFLTTLKGKNLAFYGRRTFLLLSLQLNQQISQSSS